MSRPEKTGERILAPIQAQFRRRLADLNFGEHVEFRFLPLPSEEVNAYVVGRSESDFAIVFSEEAGIALYSLYHLVLSHPRAFTRVGDASRERAWFTSLADFDWRTGVVRQMAAISERAAADPTQLFGPQDPVRREYAVRLANYALEFLFGHELAHIQCGHVRPMSEERLLEFGTRPTVDPHAALHQAREIEADCTSALLNSVFAFEGRRTGGKPDLQGFLESIALFFYVVAPEAVPLERHDMLSHPHAAVRLLSVLDYLAAFPIFKGRGIVQRAWDEAWHNVVVTAQELRVPTSVFGALLNDVDAVRKREIELRRVMDQGIGGPDPLKFLQQPDP